MTRQVVRNKGVVQGMQVQCLNATGAACEGRLMLSSGFLWTVRAYEQGLSPALGLLGLSVRPS